MDALCRGERTEVTALLSCCHWSQLGHQAQGGISQSGAQQPTSRPYPAFFWCLSTALGDVPRPCPALCVWLNVRSWSKTSKTPLTADVQFVLQPGAGWCSGSSPQRVWEVQSPSWERDVAWAWSTGDMAAVPPQSSPVLALSSARLLLPCVLGCYVCFIDGSQEHLQQFCSLVTICF